MIFVKGTDFLLEGGANTLRLAYSGVTPAQIDEGCPASRRPRGRLASLHSYGDHPSQVCELHGDSPSVAVLIHGGFWRQRYGRELEGGIARDLVARGWAVWNIEYRRLGGGGGWPRRSRTSRRRSGRCRWTPRAWSRSATRPAASSRSGPRRRASWTPRSRRRARSTSTSSPPRHLGRRRQSAARRHAGRGPHRYAQASPRRRLPIGVPLLLVHGERDDDVPVHISREFAGGARRRRRLRACGDRRRGHYEHLEPGRAAGRR